MTHVQHNKVVYGLCSNNVCQIVHVQIIYMSSGGLCPDNICPVVVYVQIIHVQRWLMSK